MTFKNNYRFQPMKYFRGQKVKFNFNGEALQGTIEILDFGGSFKNAFYFYDVYVKEYDTLYKHISKANSFISKRHQ